VLKRGVGYCENVNCEDFSKGVFLLNHGDTFYCPRCRAQGSVEKERGHYTGNSEIFKEVRVEYNYDPTQKRYCEIAIVRDESMWGRCNVYTLHTPLVKTEKRALKIAEAILSNLNRYSGVLGEDGVPRTTEIVISFDEPREELSRKLSQLAETWAVSDRKFAARKEESHAEGATD
jgi:ribosomal protein S27AE